MSTASMLRLPISSNIRHVGRAALRGSGPARMMPYISSDLGDDDAPNAPVCVPCSSCASVDRSRTGMRSLRRQPQMMNICAGVDYQAADAKLNAAYQNLIGSEDVEGKRLLQAAQRAWIAFPRCRMRPRHRRQSGRSIHRWRFRNA